MCIIPSAVVAEPERERISSDIHDATVGPTGKLHTFDDVVTGDYVNFNVSAETGEITNLSLMSNVEMVRLIERITIEGMELPKNSIKVAGAVIKFGNDTVEVMAHDNPTGLIQIKNNGGEENVTILFPEGMELDLKTNVDNSTIVFIEAAGIYGIVHVENGNITLDDTDNGDYVNVTMESKDMLMVRFQPMVGERNGELERAVLEGIALNVVASEITVTTNDSGFGHEETVYDENMDLAVERSGEDSVLVQATSTVSQGKVLFISIDDAVLGGPSGIDVSLDGVKLTESSAAGDLIDAALSSSDQATFYYIINEDVAQLLVYIPAFSMHEVFISPSTSAGPSDFEAMDWGLAVFGAVGILALASYMVIRRH